MKLQLGSWISTGSSIITELAGLCGLDWILLDLEHGCTTATNVLPQLQSLAGTHTQAIVRVNSLAPEQIALVLDWNAHGIMVPHVSTAEKARAFVQAAYHPPRGSRGVAKTVRATGYGLRSHAENPPPLLIAQIESGQAVENAPSIAAVEGIDVLFVGPADLQQDLAHHGAAYGRSYEQSLQHVCQAAASHNKSAGILLRNADDIERHTNLGFSFIAVESDIGILRSAYKQLMAHR